MQLGTIYFWGEKKLGTIYIETTIYIHNLFPYKSNVTMHLTGSNYHTKKSEKLSDQIKRKSN